MRCLFINKVTDTDIQTYTVRAQNMYSVLLKYSSFYTRTEVLQITVCQQITDSVHFVYTHINPDYLIHWQYFLQYVPHREDVKMWLQKEVHKRWILLYYENTCHM